MSDKAYFFANNQSLSIPSYINNFVNDYKYDEVHKISISNVHNDKNYVYDARDKFFYNNNNYNNDSYGVDTHTNDAMSMYNYSWQV